MQKEIKFLEIRDRGTFIPVLAYQVSSEDGYLARRAGFGPSPLTVVSRIVNSQSGHDPFKWEGGARTMREAHLYIQENFNRLIDGQVIDVEHITGESPTVKVSEISNDPLN